MTKRSNPSNTPDEKDDSKKPRTDSPARKNQPSTPSPPQAAAAAATANGASTNTTARAAPKAARRTSKIPPASSSKSSGTVGSKSNGGSVGNSFLRSQRETKQKAAEPEKSDETPSMQPQGSDDDAASVKNDVPPSEKPVQGKDALKKESKNKLLATALAFFLLALNAASVAYIIFQRSQHNVAQIRYSLEVDSLKEELSKNRDMVAVLRSGMDATSRRIEFVEQANAAKKRALKEREKDKKLSIMSEEEQNQWLERVKNLEDEWQILLRFFNRRSEEGVEGTRE